MRNKTFFKSLENIITASINGKYPIVYKNESNLLEEGFSLKLGESPLFTSTPKERKIVSLAPRSSILIKKKAFSTLKSVNDLQWMDRTEKMLLRATKTLFAYKVSQIRAYEALIKFDDYFKSNSQISLNLLADLIDLSRGLSLESDVAYTNSLFKTLVDIVGGSIADAGYDKYKEDILLLAERRAFAEDNSLTTWIVDPNNLSNYQTGPGTGVIEIGLYSNFTTNNNLNSDPSNASFELQDPYKIMNIGEADIELAIEDALTGTVGVLSSLVESDAPNIDARSVLSAGLELVGLGSLDKTIDVDYIRDRLRVFYLGKPFINAGDGVHIYIRGNKAVQSFDEYNSYVDASFSAIDETVLEAERILFTSGNIDLESYKKIRQLTDNSFGMKHVFGGLVKIVEQSWSNGSWSLSVNCLDSMAWLTWSRFMMQPSLQDSQGILEDPLTPYEIKTDASGFVLSAQGPQLLEENKYLIRSGLLTYDSGLLNGQVATEQNLLQGQFNKSGSLSGTKILQHPNGLVYRWKNGIITATAGLTLTDPMNESQITQKVHNQTYGLTVAQDVLNNLDIANVLSLLIVGQPYNVQSFIAQAQQVHNLSRASSVSSISQTDPLSAVIDVIRRQNNYFGNFKPYRMITMSNETLLQSAQNVLIRNDVNSNITKLQARRAELNELIRRLESSNSGTATSGNIFLASLKEERFNIENGIAQQIKLIQESGTITSADLVTQNYNLFGRVKSLPLSGNYTADHQISRAMAHVGAQRRIEDVRLNRDQNLFIISDQYDENTDLRAFLFDIQNADYKIFKGSFVDVYNKCAEVAKFANFEFFANSQGHLEFRPPQWNKTPLSILNRLFEISKNSNKKLVPQFLLDMFSNRTSSLRREIHKLNIRIVLLALLLNRYPDPSIIPGFASKTKEIYDYNILAGSKNLTKNSNIYLRFFGVDGVEPGDPGASSLRDKRFQFTVGGITDTGNQILGVGFNLLGSNGKDGDILYGNTTMTLGSFDPIFQESINLTNNVLTVAADPSVANINKLANANNLNYLRENFIKLSGLDPVGDIVTTDGKFSDADFITSKPKTPQDGISKANNYLKKLQETISNRDNLVTILKRNIEKQQELENVESILSGEFNQTPTDVNSGLLSGVINSTNDAIDVLSRASNTIKTITDIFTGDVNQGSLFDHLIEDDTKNITGPGSGRRFIINDEDIISCNFVESPPDFCRVDVLGDAPAIANLNAPFEERYYWAGATDFDLWRQYGFQSGSAITIPFASDPETNCRPYAIMELQLQRVKINQATITVVGNEYYEVGDIVYVPAKELLYYVRSVSHSFAWGSQFTTTLTLEYGHPPGTYLPSPMDIIGQQYTKDPLTGTQLTYRNMRGDDSYQVLQPDSALVFPPNQTISTEQIHILLDHKDNAVRFTNMMIDLSSIITGERLILLRGFIKDRNTEDEERVKNNLSVFAYLLQNPVALQQSQPTSTFDDLVDIGSSASRGLGRVVGNKKTTVQLKLPNGLPVVPVPADKIVQQIVYLDGLSSTAETQALDTKILSAQVLDSQLVETDDFDTVFPKGGPKQRSWLDIRDESGITGLGPVTNVSNIIEIGILDINRRIKTTNEIVDVKEL